MGFLKDLVGIAAPIAGTFLGGPVGGAIGGALGGAISGSGQPKSQTSTTQQQLDPRISNMLFGTGGQQGLLGQFQGLLNTPQSDASKNWSQTNANYLNQNGGADLSAVRGAANGLLSGNAAPQAASVAPTTATHMNSPAWATGNMVKAPGQNNMDLTGSYDRFINGTPGANPYLDKSIDGAIAQNRLGFQQLQDDSTKNLMQNIMPSIRSNSVLAGQYGGSRQGIAEGNAIGTQQTELARAASQFSQNATNAAVGAKANAYETDSNRALSATQGLGAQQYGVAQQDAATKNQAEFMNVGTHNDVLKTNAGLAQNANQFNAGLQQQTNLANLQAQLTNNGQNNSSAAVGGGLLSGLLGQTSGAVNAQDNYGINKAQGVNSLLAPYLGANSSTTNSQPLYSNPTGNALGGALMGGQLAGMFGGSSSGSSGGLGDLLGIGTKGGGLFGSGSFF